MSLKDEYGTKLQEVERGDFDWLHDKEKYSQAIEELMKALTAQKLSDLLPDLPWQALWEAYYRLTE